MSHQKEAYSKSLNGFRRRESDRSGEERKQQGKVEGAVSLFKTILVFSIIKEPKAA